MRKVYYEDVLKAYTDADLGPFFHPWADVKYPDAHTYYEALYREGLERGMERLLEQIKSGEFQRELDEHNRWYYGDAA
jgi:hypothetical protein